MPKKRRLEKKKKEKGKPKRPKEERKPVVKKSSFFAMFAGTKGKEIVKIGVPKKKGEGKPKRPKEKKLAAEKPVVKEKELLKLLVPKKKGEGNLKRLKEKKLAAEKPVVKKLQDKEKELVKIGVPGFDELFRKAGIIRGTSILIEGGPGTCKTIFALQTLYNAACRGHDCIYLTLEEAPERLLSHLLDFGFDVKESKREKDAIFLRAGGKGMLVIKRLEPITIARSVEALLERASGRLSIDAEIVLDFLPQGFHPFMLALDSISAMATAFSGRFEQYRIYIEQLFRYFEKLKVTSFLIAEVEEVAGKIISRTGVEEFLADGIIAFYYYKAGMGRIRAVEIVKMRGSSHSPYIIPMRITDHGLVVSPKAPGAEITARQAEFVSAIQTKR